MAETPTPGAEPTPRFSVTPEGRRALETPDLPATPAQALAFRVDSLADELEELSAALRSIAGNLNLTGPETRQSARAATLSIMAALARVRTELKTVRHAMLVKEEDGADV